MCMCINKGWIESTVKQTAATNIAGQAAFCATVYLHFDVKTWYISSTFLTNILSFWEFCELFIQFHNFALCRVIKLEWNASGVARNFL